MLFSQVERAAVMAVMDDGDRGAQALRTWLDSVDFDHAGLGSWRMAPLLHQRARQHDLRHPLVERLKGLARHHWLAHELRMQALWSLTDVAGAVTPVVLIASFATVARLGEQCSFWAIVHGEVLVSRPCAREALGALIAHGWNAPAFTASTTHDFQDRHLVRVEKDATGRFDLCWDLASWIPDSGYAGVLLGRADHVSLRDRVVQVPALDDHLLLLLTRTEDPFPWRVDWALETALILRELGGDVDWRRLRHTIDRLGLSRRIGTVAASLRDELGVAVPQHLLSIT